MIQLSKFKGVPVLATFFALLLLFILVAMLNGCDDTPYIERNSLDATVIPAPPMALAENPRPAPELIPAMSPAKAQEVEEMGMFAPYFYQAFQGSERAQFSYLVSDWLSAKQLGLGEVAQRQWGHPMRLVLFITTNQEYRLLWQVKNKRRAKGAQGIEPGKTLDGRWTIEGNRMLLAKTGYLAPLSQPLLEDRGSPTAFVQFGEEVSLEPLKGKSLLMFASPSDQGLADLSN